MILDTICKNAQLADARIHLGVRLAVLEVLSWIINFTKKDENYV